MRYVMVPVPSEFVIDVMRMVVFRAPEDDDEGSAMREETRLRGVMRDAEPPTRSLLILLAKATIEGTQVRFTDAAEALEVDGEVLIELIRELNALALGYGRSLVGISEELAVRVHGNVGKNRYLVMRPDHARLIRSLARAIDAPDA